MTGGNKSTNTDKSSVFISVSILLQDGTGEFIRGVI